MDFILWNTIETFNKLGFETLQPRSCPLRISIWWVAQGNFVDLHVTWTLGVQSKSGFYQENIRIEPLLHVETISANNVSVVHIPLINKVVEKTPSKF